MSWKNTDPLELWKTSTTLPIPAGKNDTTVIESTFGTAKTKFWTSVNSMGPKRKAEFFSDMLKVWPYTWERLAARWSARTIGLAAFVSSGYIAVKVTADVFLTKPRFRDFFSRAHNKLPIVFLPCVVASCTELACQAFLTKPYVCQEGRVPKESLFKNASLTVLAMGIVFPLFSSPPLANAMLHREKRKLGLRPFPKGTMMDLFLQTYECTRSVWRKLPAIVVLNLLVACGAVTALIWARERIHDTIDLDSELIQTLIEEKQERLEQKKSKFNKMGEWMQTLLGKLVNNMPMTQGDWRDVVQGGDFEKYFYGNTTLEPSLQELESEKTPIS